MENVRVLSIAIPPLLQGSKNNIVQDAANQKNPVLRKAMAETDNLKFKTELAFDPAGTDIILPIFVRNHDI